MSIETIGLEKQHLSNEKNRKDNNKLSLSVKNLWLYQNLAILDLCLSKHGYHIQSIILPIHFASLNFN